MNEEKISKWDWLGGIVFLFVLGALVGSCGMDKSWRDDAEYHRHIEYYMDANRDVRWKWRPTQ